MGRHFHNCFRILVGLLDFFSFFFLVRPLFVYFFDEYQQYCILCLKKSGSLFPVKNNVATLKWGGNSSNLERG